MQQPILGYWEARGYAEPLRMLLTHLGVAFEDRLYHFGPAPDFNRLEWINVKETLGMEFPNLPYFIDENIKLSETLAIYEYICAKYNPSYLGNTIVEKAYVSMITGVLRDLNSQVSNACYPKEAAALIPRALESQRPVIARLVKYLEGKTFLVGDHPTYVDFLLYEILDKLDAIDASYLAGISPWFVAYKRHIRSLAHVEEFISRPSKSHLFHGPMAGWSG
ncbi:unnamed protein product [Blepharisma stoltei]|uniref:glutathione transferase n=1 Tax=Blepharisma stoltei TaxID=1481888 RepID=A0AAU9ITC3_9CILI|nr:unnamed protein product [Blepharisma stoltei]